MPNVAIYSLAFLINTVLHGASRFINDIALVNFKLEANIAADMVLPYNMFWKH